MIATARSASHSLRTIAILAASLILYVAPARAIDLGDVVLVDFGTANPTTGNYNIINSGALTIADLIRSTDGAAVGVGLVVTATNPFDNASNVPTTAGLANINTSDADVYADGFLSVDASAADTMTLTFSGLDDALAYDLSGALARSSNGDNFSTTWTIAGELPQQSDGTPADGFVNFENLRSSGGSLVVTLTDDVRQCGLAQLALVATEPIVTGGGQIALGDVVSVDFGLTLPTSGNYNVINSSVLTISELVRMSDGAGVGVGLGVTASTVFDNISNVPSAAAPPNINTTDANVYADGLLSTNGDNGSGNDVVTLTFTGLNDAFYYDVFGSLARTTGSDNFSTTWEVAGATSQISDGTPESGHVEFRGLSSVGGVLTLTLTDNVRQSGLAQLSILATDVPPVTSPADDIPCMVELAFEGGDLLLYLDRAIGTFQLQRSDDLTSFEAIDFIVEGADSDVLRLEGAAIFDPENNGRSFFRIARRPNFIIVLTDDQGYQDLGCYGSPNIPTPRIDAMAAEGVRFTDFYAQPVCGPSRDALMTGCYPLRTAHHPNVDDRTSPHPRLELSEVTVAEILRDQGYATAAYGKWDLEGRFEFAAPATHGPTGQGFDSYLATTAGDANATKAATDGTISFIQANRSQPFFSYVSYSMPHVELARSPEFVGFTGEGIYADVIAEIDFSVGRILDTLEAEGLSETTYVMFMSDNGPWYLGNSSVHITRYGGSAEAEEMGGSALPLRGDKTTSWDGGFRVPSIMWAPGRIPAGQVSSELTTIMDVMPTIAGLAGGVVPNDRVIDGHDITEIIHGVPGAESETEAVFYYVRETLHAVRAGKWKLHVPHAPDTFWERFYRTGDYFEITAPLLYDLDTDIGETTDVSASHPAIVAELLQHINFARTDIGDFDTIGANAR